MARSKKRVSTTPDEGREEPARAGNGSVDEASTAAQLEVALSLLQGNLGRLRSGPLGALAQTQYAGKRDIYQSAGYTPIGQVDFDEYWGLYKRGGIAGRIVDLLPNTCWKEAPEIQIPGLDEEEASPLLNAVEELAKRTGLWSRLARVDRLSRVGKYGVILLGTSDIQTDQDFRTPLETLNGPEDLLYLSPFSEKYARIHDWVRESKDPRFGLPKTYEVDLSAGVSGFQAASVRVHWSRIIHVAEDPLDDEVYGRPALERPLNLLSDLAKVSAATGEGYWQMADRILTGQVDPDVDLTEKQTEALGERLEEVIHNLRRQFVGRGIDLQWLDGQTPSPEDAGKFYMMLIAAAADYPMRILFGTETGERASEQDERQFHGQTQVRRTDHVGPNIIRPLLDRLIDKQILPAGDYDLSWGSLYEPTQEEIEEANKRRAEIAKLLTPVGGDPKDLITIDADGQVWLRQIDEPDEPIPSPFDPGPPEAGEE